ncbi:putative egh16h1-like protein [Golovinomyces cichoracearum]|uniref:Putative egh16h1-like protein n=1 Tax=Golovinomyces cichoracearum TaxID=62708 RepID=A0A420HJ63_9PEZI|nr:putative egh16h1-like protein [Golovinomyces cichoracearum]
MQYSSILLLSAFAVTNVFGHGVVTDIQGANGVQMNGLSVIDETPRDCPSPRCGSEADTAIIREREMGSKRASALGRTQGGGPISAEKMVSMFMTGDGGNGTSNKAARDLHAANLLRRSLVPRDANGGQRTPKGTKEQGVKAAAGTGSDSGMPTCSDDGTVTMTFHQVNQDGAGPLKAMVDGTSGGTDPAAFKPATVTQNVPGIGIGGLSGAAVMDFKVMAQMPEGMTCDASVGGADNVCIMRLNNAAAAGPFGGSVAYTMSPGAKKRAIEYQLRKRNFARALNQKRQGDQAAAILEALKSTGSATEAEDGKAEDAKITKRQQTEAAAAIAALKEMGSSVTADEAEKQEQAVKRAEDQEAAEIDREVAEDDA